MRKALLVASILVGLIVSTPLLIDQWIAFRYQDQIYTDYSQVPEKDIGMILGTSKYFRGIVNGFYQHRIDSAIGLYQHGKVEKLLVSGDNAHRSYNEPWTMKRDLLAAGVAEEDIVLDYAGFRTLDSVIRAHKVFAADELLIITQQFHCERALFIADHADLEAICFAAPSPTGGRKVRLREIFARTKAFIDIYLINKQPKFLGPLEPIMTTEPDALSQTGFELPTIEKTVSDAASSDQTADPTSQATTEPPAIEQSNDLVPDEKPSPNNLPMIEAPSGAEVLPDISEETKS
uniref:SanA/YdcF family protein n=1 Tax=Thaumasiovibrio occultus TaxID=1891184 RepID=UPI000B35F3D5|nr:ElyC/SanA/YdcF family protein [Thaumasiovibrio occultus]